MVWLETLISVHWKECFLERDRYVFDENANQHYYKVLVVIHFWNMIRYQIILVREWNFFIYDKFSDMV